MLADDATDAARKRFAEGLAAADRGNFEAARVAFRQAYLLRQEPVIAQNLGQAELLSGHFVEAARHLDMFLRTGKDAKAAVRATARDGLEKALKHVGRVELHADADAKVEIDGESVDARAIAYVDPGNHTVRTEVGTRTESRSFTVEAGDQISIDITLPPLPAASSSIQLLVAPTASAFTASPASTAHEFAPGRSTALAVGTTLAAASLGVGIVASLMASSKASRAHELGDTARAQYGSSGCVDGGPSVCAEIASAIDAQQNARSIAQVGFVAAAVLGLGTITSLTLWPSQPITVAGSPGAVAVRGRF